jgi:hypothetical protein
MNVPSLEADLMIRYAECDERCLDALRYGDAAAKKKAIFELAKATYERGIGRRLLSTE